MYKLTLALFAFLSLVPPNLAVPKLVPDNREERKHRHTKFNGTGTTSFSNNTSYNCNVTDHKHLPTVFISTALYDGGYNCGKTVKINNTVNAMINGTCIGTSNVDKCGTQGDLGLSHVVFRKLNVPEGDINIQWEFT